MRKLSSLLSIFLVLCLTVGGVSAAWVYAGGAVEALTDILASVGMGTWEFGYTVTFVNEGETLFKSPVIPYGDPIDKATMSGYATSAKSALETQINDNPTYSGYGSSFTLTGWMNSGSTIITEVESGNIDNIVLYPSFDNLYTASFVNQDGSLIAWCYFTLADGGQDELVQQEAIARQQVKDNITDSKLHYDYWFVRYTDGETEGNAKFYMDKDGAEFKFTFKGNATIYPYYEYSGAKVEGVDIGNDGDTDYYEVLGYPEGTSGLDLVEIPAQINGKDVTTITANAFMSYADLHSVRIPATVTSIGAQSFADFEGILRKRQTVTIYYEGTPEQWAQYMKEVYTDKNYEHFASDWDNAMGEKSAVFFLDENGKVDLSKGYWELADTSAWYQSAKFEWQYHNHPYGSGTCSGNEHNNTTNYSGACDCDSCDGATRPDAHYWN